MAGVTFAGSAEVLLSLVDIAGQKILRVDALSSSFLRFRDDPLRLDKSDQPQEFLVRHCEARHTAASIAHYGADLIPADIVRHQLGAGQVGPGFSATRIAAMAESAMLNEQGLSGSDEVEWKRLARLRRCRKRLRCLGEGEWSGHEQRDSFTRENARKSH
jgi:hypothetical protein